MDGLRMYSYIYGGNTNVNGGNIYVNLGKASKMQHNARPWHINYVGLRHTHHHACPQQLPYHFTITVMASNIPDTHQACPSLAKLCESNLDKGTEDTLKVCEGGLKLHSRPFQYPCSF